MATMWLFVRSNRAKLAEGGIAVIELGELRAARLSGKQLLALWNALPGTERLTKVGAREKLLDRLWAAMEALLDPDPVEKRPSQKQRDCAPKDTALRRLHPQSNPDPVLIKAIGRAHRFNEKPAQGKIAKFGDLAKGEGLHGSYLTRLLRLAYLAPDITAAILDGRQPADLTATMLIEHPELPLSWSERRRVLGFG